MSRPSREALLEELARWSHSKDPVKWYGDTGGCILSNAIWLRDVELVRIILSAGFPNALQSHDDRSPLSSAVESGELEIVRCLVEAGADPNGNKAEDHTPLQYAVQINNARLVSYLLSVGADPRYSPLGKPHYLRTAETKEATNLIYAALTHPNPRDDSRS